METRYWFVRAGVDAILAPQFLEKQVVAVGWAEVGDMSDLGSVDEIKLKFLPGQSKFKVGQAAAQLFNFAIAMAEGDLVLIPVTTDNIQFGVVQGPYQFDPNLIKPDYPHIRRVQWGQTVAYRQISAGLRRSIESPRVVYEISKGATEIERLVKMKPILPREKVYGLPKDRITQIRFERFKSFAEQTSVDLAPITLVAGVNSGGKTSILQSILLARQTLLTPYRSTTDEALKYDGDLVRFASFNELIFDKPANSKGWLQLGFSVRYLERKRRITEYFPEVPTSAEEVVITVDLDVKFGYDRHQKLTVVEAVNLAASTLINSESCIGPQMRIEPQGRSNAKINLAVGKDKYRETSIPLRFDRFIPTIPIIIPSSQDEPVIRAFNAVFRRALQVLRNDLENRLFYVGPLRSAPQRPYLRRNIVGLDMGPAGENVMQLLHDNWETEIVFVEAPISTAEFQYSELKPSQVKLKEAVRLSLQLLGMDQELKIEKRGESYEASLSLLSKPATFIAITEVGFGVSQILPIITAGLLSPANAILVFEQPEIHLHPRAQAGLAELILCLAKTGRRILIETHSDHLINRLRRRTAEDKSDTLEQQVSILFVTPPAADGQGTKVVRACIDRYGEIENWPPGFLAESAQDARAIMIAGSTKRLKEQREGDQK